MRMQSDNDFFTEANNAIKNNYQRTNNLRLGAEVKVAEFYRLRGGYAIYQNPYKNDGGINLNRYALTGGIGFLIDRIFVDFAVVNSYGKQFISPYTTGDVNKPDPKALNAYSIYNFVLSGGIRF
jgi:long-subunit fatty acid transport protein